MPLELVLKSCGYREWPRRKCFAGLYMPLGEPRIIPAGANLHVLVTDRMTIDPSDRPINLPATFNTVR